MEEISLTGLVLNGFYYGFKGLVKVAKSKPVKNTLGCAKDIVTGVIVVTSSSIKKNYFKGDKK